MKYLLALLLLISSLSYGQQLIDSRQQEIVFTSVNVVPMDTETILTDQTVVIKDGKVQAIGKKVKYGKGHWLLMPKANT